MKRAFLASLSAGAMVAASAATASAAEPRIYHVIKDAMAYAEVTEVDASGCVETSVWLTSSDAMYTGRATGLNKQDRTTVDLVVRDVCAVPEGAVAAAAGPGVVLFEASGETAVAPVIDTRLTRASVSADFVNADGVPFSVDATWTGTGELTRSHVNNHANEGIGVVSSTSNELRRDAAADVTVSVGDHGVAATTDNAFLTTTRFRCVEVPRPGVEDYYPCFGFPG